VLFQVALLELKDAATAARNGRRVPSRHEQIGAGDAGTTEAGAIVYPPVPAFDSRPASLEEIVDHTVGRVLDLFGLDTGTLRGGIPTTATPRPDRTKLLLREHVGDQAAQPLIALVLVEAPVPEDVGL
jgi:hypothetical protein